MKLVQSPARPAALGHLEPCLPILDLAGAGSTGAAPAACARAEEAVRRMTLTRAAKTLGPPQKNSGAEPLGHVNPKKVRAWSFTFS